MSFSPETCAVIKGSVGKAGGIAPYDEQAVQAQIVDGVYPGADLTVKFADEIAAAPYSGDAWAWIKARIAAGDFRGIHIADYIPIAFTSPSSFTLNAQIAGINTYKGYGDAEVGNHIDFVCRELWPTSRPVNLGQYTNGCPAFTPEGGTEQPAVKYPWLACDLYRYLNSLSGYVPSSTNKFPPDMQEVDYTQGGVYYYLPAALKAVIVEKRAYLPERYGTSAELTDDNFASWASIGKLWLPSETEVYGIPVVGGKGRWTLMGDCVQYPIFRSMANRVKKRSGSRDTWWLITPYTGTTNWSAVLSYGSASAYQTSYENAAPVCFRIA